jgi:hypothetical protein
VANDNSPQLSRRAANDNAKIHTEQRTARDNFTETQSRISKTRALVEAGTAVTNKTKGLARMAKATELSVTYASALIPFWGAQLLFGLLQFGGAAGEKAGESFLWGLGAVFIPGKTLFAAGYFLTVTISLLLLIGLALAYTLSGVRWWRRFGWASFLLYMVGSFIPFINMVPWSGAFMLSTVYTQK